MQQRTTARVQSKRCSMCVRRTPLTHQEKNLRKMEPIAHICALADWSDAQEQGAYRAVSLLSEGFTHCSTAAQVLEVANSYYLGESGLVLLWIDPQRLDVPLRWEAPSHPAGSNGKTHAGELFPHIYGPVSLDAVIAVCPLEPDADGVYRFLPQPPC